MGGAPGSVRLLALGVAAWCALAPGCASSGDEAATPPRQARGVSVRGATPGAASADDPEQGGAPAEPAVAPTAEEASQAGTAASAKDLPLGASGEGPATGGSGGDVAVGGDDGADSAAAGAPTVLVGNPPTCGKQRDGTLCGANMTPAGAEGTRYFCSAGVVLAEARCPGACDAETNACVQSGGTGGGIGETGLYTALRCRQCYATTCRDQLMKCQADAPCTAHLECYESCGLDGECLRICDAVFADEPSLGALDRCALETGCAGKCPETSP